MEKSNKVFIATSLDGYIAEKDGGISFLESIPELNEVDTGYHDFIAGIDALVMGRYTFEKVCSFDIDWPYSKPVYVVSNTLTEVPQKLDGKVFLVKGGIEEILAIVHGQGHHNLYVDGGQLIQSFLKEELISEMIITIIPILLGDGIRLFGELNAPQQFECKRTKLFVDKVVQNHYIKKEAAK